MQFVSPDDGGSRLGRGLSMIRSNEPGEESPVREPDKIGIERITKEKRRRLLSL